MLIEFNDWDALFSVKVPEKQALLDAKLETRVKEITFNYDIGRCTVYFNNVEVFNSMNVGSDFQLKFTFNGIENKDG